MIALSLYFPFCLKVLKYFIKCSDPHTILDGVKNKNRFSGWNLWIYASLTGQYIFTTTHQHRPNVLKLLILTFSKQYKIYLTFYGGTASKYLIVSAKHIS